MERLEDLEYFLAHENYEMASGLALEGATYSVVEPSTHPNLSGLVFNLLSESLHNTVHLVRTRMDAWTIEA